MSDLSSPPLVAYLSEATPDGPSQLRDVGPRWPGPPLLGFDQTADNEEEGHLLCDLVGTTGSGLRRLRLLHIDFHNGRIVVQATPGSRPIEVHFEHFQRLSLVPLLRPQPWHLKAGPRKYRPELFSARMISGTTYEGLTLGRVSAESGYFVYEVVDEYASVRRTFIPRCAVAHMEFGQDLELRLEPQTQTQTQTQTKQTQTKPESESESESDGASSMPELGAANDVAEHTPQHVDAHAASAVSKVDAVGSSVGSAGEVALDPKRQLAVSRILSDSLVGDVAELNAALDRQDRMPVVRLGEALVALGHITPDQLSDAIAQHRAQRKVPLGEQICRQGLISREVLQSTLARKMGYPVVELSNFQPDTEALCLVPKALALRLQALPLTVRQGRVVVAVFDPANHNSLNEFVFVTGIKATPVLASCAALQPAIERAYQKLGADNLEDRAAEVERTLQQRDAEFADSSELLASLELETTAQTDEEVGAIEQTDNSLVRLINSMILEAQAQEVSDIHIETQPGKQKVRIRFRSDGVLKPYLELPYTYRAAITARLKIMCDLDISEKRKPQDGKITFGKFVAGSRLELRVATLPTTSGLEDIVLRLLASAKAIPLADLGLTQHNLEHIKAIVQRPYGMFLCVGPTGSGKTTTLHSALGFINGPDRKIVTAEDPIEITQAGLRQVQVNPKIDWTFAKALRAFLRADPDVIMVGEIRDHETAQMAVESSLTGHLVLSTLHTNSAPETVTRLLDMGMDPFNFGDSLLGVLAQRLVRRLCAGCRVARVATEDEVQEWIGEYRHGFGDAAAPPAEALRQEWTRRFGRRIDNLAEPDQCEQAVLPYHYSPGCENCGGTGFRGRVGVHELLTVNRTMRQLIQSRGRIDEIQRVAIESGMRTLRQDGIEKVLTGATSMAEVRSTTNS